MTLNNVLLMLFGATLMAVGVLASALADRVRGLRVSRDTAPRGRVQAASPAIPVVEAADLPVKPAARVRAEPKSAAPKGGDGGEDVIAALVAAGYKRPIATEATWACGAGERASIEGWVACALRRCARGGVS